MTKPWQKILKEKSWHFVDISSFKQDTSGFEDMNGTWWNPTYNWHAQIIALRSDGVWFHVDAIIKQEDVDAKCKVNLNKVSTLMMNVLRTLESYRNCKCIVNKPCKIHREEHAND